MRLFYYLGILFYTGFIYLVSPFNRKAYLWIRGRRGWAEDLGAKFSGAGKTVWVHCASLGEFEQARPVIEKIRETIPGYKILVTFFSPSGYEIRKDWPFADHISYLPTDTPGNSDKFIRIVNPSIAIFIKYEFWNNYISALHSKGIPVFLVSGIFRPDQHFFKWYGGFFRDLLKKFSTIFVQDEVSSNLLTRIGISENVIISGDTRFDRVFQIARAAKSIPVIESFGNGEKIFLAGSTWPHDEGIIARYINNYPDRMKWIFAPHEIDQSGIDRLERLLKVKTVRYSDSGADLSDARVLIIDNIGLLSSAYRYAYIAEVGGGFGRGIHNILEAACWGIPVMIGPNHKKFREAVELCEEKGAFSFNSYQEFVGIIDKLLGDSAFYFESAKSASLYVSKNTGATEKILKEIYSKIIDKAGS
jgi:3-deoxy-D-manno-octulosonic-acid transferase